jgi:hypothetical protein
VKRAVTVIAALLALLPGIGSAQEMGRLFLTPEQRETLDARRRAKVPDKPGAAPAAPVTRIDGYVQRSGGKSTIWVNGEAQAEGAAQTNARIQPSSGGETSVTVPVGEDARSARARAGQTVDSATGEVRDVLGDGEIKVRRAPERPAARK